MVINASRTATALEKTISRPKMIAAIDKPSTDSKKKSGNTLKPNVEVPIFLRSESPYPFVVVVLVIVQNLFWIKKG